VKKDFQEMLCQKYPKLLRTKRIETGDGWYHIIDSLCETIQNRMDWSEGAESRVEVNQIREKFGSLEFYFTGGDEVVSGMVASAESISRKTCESCSMRGEQRSSGWIVTLCDKCFKGWGDVGKQTMSGYVPGDSSVDDSNEDNELYATYGGD